MNLYKSILAITGLCLVAFSVKAEGTEIIYYRCEPNKDRVYVGTAISAYPTSDFGPGVIPLGSQKQQTLECQIAPRDKVTVLIGESPTHPGNDNIQISINGKLFDYVSFNPDKEVSHLITRYDGKGIKITSFSKSVTAKTRDWPSDSQ